MIQTIIIQKSKCRRSSAALGPQAEGEKLPPVPVLPGTRAMRFNHTHTAVTGSLKRAPAPCFVHLCHILPSVLNTKAHLEPTSPGLGQQLAAWCSSLSPVSIREQTGGWDYKKHPSKKTKGWWWSMANSSVHNLAENSVSQDPLPREDDSGEVLQALRLDRCIAFYR